MMSINDCINEVDCPRDEIVDGTCVIGFLDDPKFTLSNISEMRTPNGWF